MDRMSDLFSEAMNHLEHMANHGSTPCDVMTGFEQLDKLLCGFDNGDLIVVGSRPGVGKTSFIISCALNNARAGVPVLYYSLDMTGVQVTKRFMSVVTGVGLDKIRAGKLTQKEQEDLVARTRELGELPLFIVSNAPRKIEDLCDHIEKQVKASKAGIVYIDYLQLLECKVTHTVENRYQEVSKFSRSLKALAHQLNIPVVVTSQLNRKPEERQEKYDRILMRPNMHDLRDSGTICEDANLVFLLSRPELYYHYPEDEKGRDIRGLAEVVVAKNNNGPTDMVELHFDKVTCAFSDQTF